MRLIHHWHTAVKDAAMLSYQVPVSIGARAMQNITEPGKDLTAVQVKHTKSEN